MPYTVYCIVPVWYGKMRPFSGLHFRPVLLHMLLGLHANTYICHVIGASWRADDGTIDLGRRYLVLLLFLWGDASWEAQRLGPLGQTTDHSGTMFRNHSQTEAANTLSASVLPVSPSVFVPLISLCINRSYICPFPFLIEFLLSTTGKYRICEPPYPISRATSAQL